MYPRIFNLSFTQNHSYLILGPRGTGKSTWIREQLKPDVYLDLLKDNLFQRLSASPEKLIEFISVKNPNFIVIDEIQKVPALTNEVHRLIEEKKWRFVLTGSSARKLKKSNANLLAGRALLKNLYPLTAKELGDDFDLFHSLEFGHLPSLYSKTSFDKLEYLKSYITAYLREELIQEGIIRNVQSFSKFLEAASFSQASVLNVSNIAKDVDKEPKVIGDYFDILEDLLIGHRLKIFSRKGTRKTIKKSKFYFFDVGVYRTLRPSGPLDDDSGLRGHAFETLVYQEIRALNSYLNWNFELSYWHTDKGDEVDFILYGKKGLFAIECKCSKTIHSSDLKSLKYFKKDFKPAQLLLVYGGDEELILDEVKIVPISLFLKNMEKYLSK
jgi:predicted AAA+ superfamily ATPase